MIKQLHTYLGIALLSMASLPASAAVTYTVPFSEKFAKDNFANFTIIDSNNDESTWKYLKNFDDIDAAFIDTGNASNDDWLILPAMQLSNECQYKLSFTIHGRSYNYNECAELYIGTAPTAEGMTKKVVEVIDIMNYRANPLTKGETFSVAESGTYYVGLHASSGYKRNGIYVLDISLEEDRLMSTPAAPTDFAVVADIHGALTAEVSLTVPAKNILGNDLSGTVTVDVKRDGTTIKTFENQTPGASISFEDTATEGLHNYEVVASNASGLGDSATASAFFGFDLPKAPAAISIKETSNGKVLITWDAVTEDVNGKIYPDGEISYKVYGTGGVSLVSKLRDTSYTDNATTGTQMFVNYGVTAISAKGEGDEFILSDIIPVGKPYALPWCETLNANGLSTIVRYDDFDRYMRFNINNTADSDFKDADDSGFYMAAVAYDQNERGRLYTGKIDLAGTTYPAFTMSYYQIPGCNNTIEVLVSDGGEWTSLKKIKISGDKIEWAQLYVDLSAYKDKAVQLGIEVTTVTHTTTGLDNFKVCDHPATDLYVRDFSAPATAKIANEAYFNTVVANNGGTAATGYTVALMRGGEKVAEKTATEALAPGANAAFAFTDVLDVTAAEENDYYVVVTIDGDDNTADNTSKHFTVATIQPVYPYVTTLDGAADNQSVALTWSEPDMDTMVFEPVLESFENIADFTIDPECEWTFIDGDQSKTYYLEDFEFPNQGKPMAAMVIPSSHFSGWSNFDSHSGSKMLASFSAVNGPNDDWFISPELIGDEQTVSFFAKSMSSVYPDSFEFYYSTTGKEINDFIQKGDAIQAPHDWTEYSYNLPEGAKYFAVRYISGDGFVFMMDDFSFVPESAKRLMEELSLVGYNIYRDNVKVNAQPVEETEFTDADVPAGDHTYNVTAIYTQGESRLGKTVEVNVAAGINGVTVENAAVEYYNLQGIKVDTPRQGEFYIRKQGTKANVIVK